MRWTLIPRNYKKLRTWIGTSAYLIWFETRDQWFESHPSFFWIFLVQKLQKVRNCYYGNDQGLTFRVETKSYFLSNNCQGSFSRHVWAGTTLVKKYCRDRCWLDRKILFSCERNEMKWKRGPPCPPSLVHSLHKTSLQPRVRIRTKYNNALPTLDQFSGSIYFLPLSLSLSQTWWITSFIIIDHQ